VVLRGWLANPERQARRDNPKTLTDTHVKQLIKEIDSIPLYSKLEPELDRLLRMRDQALIALSWIFIKRGGECLKVKFENVYYDEGEISVTFRISKKTKRLKLCPSCHEKNPRLALFCRRCGQGIGGRMPTLVKSPDPVTRTDKKTRSFWACRYVVQWLEAIKGEIQGDGYIFAPFNYFAKTFQWNKRLTVQRFDQILQRLDPSLTSHLFRYGGTEKLLAQGYEPMEIKEIGGWSSVRMVEIYAQRKGYTASLKKHTRDSRTFD